VRLLGGEFRRVRGASDLAASDGARSVDVFVDVADAPGIDLELAFEGSRGRARLAGAYRVGGAWHYELSIDGAPIVLEARGDLWLEANGACVGVMLDAIEGRASREDALALGAYDARAALALEALLALG
jgi:hypothetical protein